MSTVTPAAPARPVARATGMEPTTFRVVVVWLACGYAFTVPLLNAVTLPGLGTASRAAGAAFTAAGIVALAVERSPRRLGEAQVIGLALLAWGALSRLWSTATPATDTALFTLVQLVVVFLLTWEFCRTRTQVLALLRAFVLGAAGLATTLVVGALTAGTDAARYSVADTHPNSLGFVVSLAIIPAWYFAVTSRRAIVRLTFGLYPALALLAVVLTASRGALIVTGVALLIVPLLSRSLSLRARMLGVVLLVGAACLAVVVAPPRTLERLSTTMGQVESADLNGRAELWVATARIVSDTPVLGVGLGTTSEVLLREYGVERGSHNTLLAVGLELGMLGLLLFLLLLVACLVPTLRVRGPDGTMARLLGTTLLIGLMPRHWHLEKTTWLMLAVLVGLAAAQRHGKGWS